MQLHEIRAVRLLVLVAGGLLADPAVAESITGHFGVTTSTGHPLEINIAIDPTTTTFELTGPDFSWFAFGFNTQSMMGYALIVEGTDNDRAVVEQNLVFAGDPGTPQTVQNIAVVDLFHHEADDLTTLVITRPNTTGDPEDLDFSTNLAELDIIWAYDQYATRLFPNPAMAYHGGARGAAVMTFAVIPEPGTLILISTAALVVASGRRLRCV